MNWHLHFNLGLPTFWLTGVCPRITRITRMGTMQRWHSYDSWATRFCTGDVRGKIHISPMFAGLFLRWFAWHCPFSPKHESVPRTVRRNETRTLSPWGRLPPLPVDAPSWCEPIFARSPHPKAFIKPIRGISGYIRAYPSMSGHKKNA